MRGFPMVPFPTLLAYCGCESPFYLLKFKAMFLGSLQGACWVQLVLILSVGPAAAPTEPTSRQALVSGHELRRSKTTRPSPAGDWLSHHQARTHGMHPGLSRPGGQVLSSPVQTPQLLSLRWDGKKAPEMQVQRRFLEPHRRRGVGGVGGELCSAGCLSSTCSHCPAQGGRRQERARGPLKTSHDHLGLAPPAEPRWGWGAGQG